MTLSIQEKLEKRRALWRKYYYRRLASGRNSEKTIKYYHTENGKASFLKSIKTYQTANPDRLKAWQKAKSILLKPCQVCGIEKTHRHHPDTTKPLEVMFLCPLHHKRIHMI